MIEKRKGRFLKSVKGFFVPYNLALYLLLLLPMAYIFIFSYLPLGGLVIAFKNYTPTKGIFGSPWTTEGGFHWFKYFVTRPQFWELIRNTLVLSVYSIAINTVLPIILALFINEIRHKHFKKVVQTISYAPYFVSTIVVCGMLFSFSRENGIIYKIIEKISGESIRAMESSTLFPHLYVWSGVWQGLGWWAIIYVGTLANVDMSLHEAAIIDGAGRMSRIWHINLPAIIPMAVIMFIMSIGNMLSVGFEKVYLMQTDRNLSASRIISTYVYEISLGKTSGQPQYSYATAIGLFNSIINIILLFLANTISRKVGETSLW